MPPQNVLTSKKLKSSYLVLTTGLFFFIIFGQTVQAEVQVELRVLGCNNNNICESWLTEDELTCSNDCTTCNFNNICEVLKGESYNTCPSDCVVPTPTPTPTVTPEPSSVPTPSPSVQTTYQSGSSGSGTRIILINNVKLVTESNKATISWDTSVPTFGQIQWGTTGDYDLGSINNINVALSHVVILDNLLPNTIYYFKIVSSLPLVRQTEYKGSFLTTESLDMIPPANVSNLEATPEGNDVILSWLNPVDRDLAGIKVLRSPYFYPENQNDGKLIYEGQGSYVRDINIDPKRTYYYAVFAYDFNRNYSSGSLIMIGSSTPRIDLNKLISLTIQDFDFIQNHLGLPSSNDTVRLYPFYPTDILISKDKLSDSVVFLILNIKDPISGINIASYKMALSNDKKTFAAKMGLLGTTGNYPVIFDLVNSDNKIIGKIAGTFDVRVVRSGPLLSPGFYILISILIASYLISRLIKGVNLKSKKQYKH